MLCDTQNDEWSNKRLVVKKENYGFGLSTLHAWIRLFFLVLVTLLLSFGYK